MTRTERETLEANGWKFEEPKFTDTDINNIRSSFSRALRETFENVVQPHKGKLTKWVEFDLNTTVTINNKDNPFSNYFTDEIELLKKQHNSLINVVKIDVDAIKNHKNDKVIIVAAVEYEEYFLNAERNKLINGWVE